MTLDDVHPGKIVKISQILGGRGVHLNLARLGVYKGDKLKVLGSAPFGGPILLEHLSSGARIALGREVSKKITIEEVNEE